LSLKYKSLPFPVPTSRVERSLVVSYRLTRTTSATTKDNDNVRIPQTRVMEEWFREHQTSFSHIDWSPQSPGLNLTESFWAVPEK